MNVLILQQGELHFRGIDEKHTYMSRVMRKRVFLYCENKGADQLRGHRTADQLRGHRTAVQHLCFRYIDSTMPYATTLQIWNFLAIFWGHTAQFV